MNNSLAGHLAESMARWLMRLKGYRIIAKNLITGKGTHAGEVDFVACKRHTLVFVEVKSLPKGDTDTLASELGPRKQHRIVRTARYFLMEHPEYASRFIRFDVIALDVPGLEAIHHIRGAFTESGPA